VEGYGPETYGERFADVYDEWYADVSDVEATVSYLRELAGAGPVLELGVGTGRIASRLVSPELTVVGLDASPAMLARLSSTPEGRTVIAIQGDMATPSVTAPHGPYRLIFVAFNTFFNIADADSQRASLAEIAELLGPEGRFVLEGFVLDTDHDEPTQAVEAASITADRVILRVSRHNPSDQTITGQHVDITEAGIRLRPWHLRYATPDELDDMAYSAGLVLEGRFADWNSQPFGPTSTTHVSVYQRRS